ncbi:MAG: ABC transporter permease [Pseudomonadota bacterium]
MRTVFWLTAIFLYAPIIVLIVFSFNDAGRRGGNVVWKGFTTKWYDKAWNNDQLIEAFVNSLTIAVVSTVFAVILGALTAVVLWRWRFPFKPVYEGVVALPIVVPEICLGVALAVFFSSVDPAAGVGWVYHNIAASLGATSSAEALGQTVAPPPPWPFTLTNIILAHVTFSFPFAAMVIRTRLNNFNREVEEAARDLGATEWQMFRDILLPWMKPGLVAGALLAFTLSLDDFVITFFTSGPGTVTFPVKVYSMVRFSVTPEVNAASTVLVLVTIALTAIAMWFQKFDGDEKR